MESQFGSDRADCAATALEHARKHGGNDVGCALNVDAQHLPPCVRLDGHEVSFFVVTGRGDGNVDGSQRVDRLADAFGVGHVADEYLVAPLSRDAIKPDNTYSTRAKLGGRRSSDPRSGTRDQRCRCAALTRLVEISQGGGASVAVSEAAVSFGSSPRRFCLASMDSISKIALAAKSAVTWPGPSYCGATSTTS